MNVRYARRGLASFTVASVALLAVGCGSDEKPKADKPAATTSTPRQTQGGQGQQSAEEPVEKLAVVRGQKGLEFTVSSVERDAGGFLTIKGQLENTSDSAAAISSQTSGDETEVMKHGSSFGGATLVDAVGKKRYYVLRDTDGRPLTTTGISVLSPKATAAVFLQFPAPPPPPPKSPSNSPPSNPPPSSSPEATP